MSQYIDDSIPDPEVFDSGYTPEELDVLLAPFMKKKPSWPDENMAIAMQIGLSCGDVVSMSDRGTVLLETPREELDRRVAAIKEKLAAGTPLDEAVEAVVG
jgi:hypothetical protein